MKREDFETIMEAFSNTLKEHGLIESDNSQEAKERRNTLRYQLLAGSTISLNIDGYTLDVEVMKNRTVVLHEEEILKTWITKDLPLVLGEEDAITFRVTRIVRW